MSKEGSENIKSLSKDTRLIFHIQSRSNEVCNINQNFVECSTIGLDDRGVSTLKLLSEIFIGMRDSVSMSTLPLQSKISFKSRHYFYIYFY